MGHSTLITEAMKVTLVLCASLALCLGCPDVVPMTCGEDMMLCPGIMDAAGCIGPGVCMPTKGGPIGTDGVECPVMCPTPMWCRHDSLPCNGCQWMPTTRYLPPSKRPN